MDKTVKARFKQRADTAANWTAKNPVLLQGEIGYESDTNNLKVGDGKSAWASLPYVKEKLAKVATSGSYTDLSNKPTIPSVPSSLKNPYALTFTGGASGSYDGSAAKSVAIPAVDTTLSSTSTNAIQNKAVNTALTNKADKATTISGYGITDAKIENGTITLGNNSIKPLTAHQNISGKADKATTLAGYGITDAKISNGTITLGSNSITPLVSHQSLSAYAKTADVNTALGKKADKATTLSGYGITDAKISNGVITLGTGTITPLTSHQSLSNYYKKTEVDTLITNLKAGLVNVVDSLPTTGDAGKLYLVKTGDETQNLYTEYVYINEAWEKLGTQKLDLSGYLTKTDASNTYLGKTAVASSAAKLNTDAGSVTQPIYFSGGVPKATNYTLGKSVPSNAVFTDTNNKTTQTSVTASDYTNYRPLIWGSSNSGTKGFTPTTVTDGVFASANLYCQPSTGLIHATKFEGDLAGTASNASKVNNLTVETAVPANAKFTDTVYTHPSSHAASMITGLAKVATSGSYSDLSNKPSIPTIPASLPANGGNSATVNGHTVNSDVPENAKFTDTVYILPNATSTVKGGVKVGSNITVSSGTISLTKANVTSALGYTPPTSNTTYSAGTGISLSGTTFSNSGVRTVTAGSSANQISVNTNGTTSTITVNNVANASLSNSAKKLETSRTISLGTGVTGSAMNFDGSNNITIPVTAIKESYLEWGGRSFAGSYGPIDAAMVPELGANRFAFGKAEGITVEYSTDGGATWVDYGLSNTQKIALFSTGNVSCTIGKANTSTITAKCMLRVSIDTDKFGVYTALNKFVIYVSTNGSSGCYCTIDASLESSPTTFKPFVNKTEISGWSGYNVINSPTLVTYGNSKDSQYGIIRFTFGCTGVNNTYSGLNIVRIMGFGGAGWSTPSTLAGKGTIYKYDENQNVTFPAKVTATSFEGSASSVNGITPDWSGSLSYSDTDWICAWQKDGKKIKAMSKSVFAASSHTHNYAASGSAGGAATSANKLNTNAGSATQAVYFSNGVPVACTYTVGKSVPSDAKFTDTIYSLPDATASVKGGVKVGSNITVSAGIISLTKANVTAALGYTPPTSDTTYSNMKGATSSADGTHGLVPAPAAGKQTSFLRGDGTWVIPTNTDTKYSAGTGISLSGTTFSNSGVRAISSGSSNGTISVNTNGTTANVAVKGLGSAAYTDSTAYAAASHTHSNIISTSQSDNPLVWLEIS